MNTIENHFSDKVSIKIWQQHFKLIRHLSRTLSDQSQNDLILEIQDHLYESFRNQPGDDEPERLLNAIEQMGSPEEYLHPIITDHLLSAASKTYNPATILKSLVYYLMGGLKRFLISLFMMIGYTFSLVLAFMACVKPFYPEHIGLFISPQNGVSLGFVKSASIESEILGYWMIPIGLVLSLGLYFGLTRLLRILRKKP